jgi:hypothetical protein
MVAMARNPFTSGDGRHRVASSIPAAAFCRGQACSVAEMMDLCRPLLHHRRLLFCRFLGHMLQALRGERFLAS